MFKTSNKNKLAKIGSFFFSLLLTSCVSSKDGSSIRGYINELKEQNQIPELSKAEMYADFDTLISIMERCNPQYLIRKKATGYDMIAEMKTQRMYIEYCDNTSDFITLLKKVLGLSLDPHCNASGSLVWHHKYSIFKKDIEINEITNTDFGINFHYMHDIFYKNPTILDLQYIQGEYFLKFPTRFFTDADSILMPAGTKVVSFNRQLIKNIQNRPINWYSCWDSDKQTYYNSKLHISNPINNIKFDSGYNITECSFTGFSQIKRNVYPEGYLTKWLEKDSVLYIVIPAMNYVPSWLKKLKSDLLHHRKKPIQGVIIDIRGNRGGDDGVWIEVMEMITKIPIEYPYSYLTTMDKEVAKRTIPENKILIAEERNQRRVMAFIDSSYVFRTSTEVIDTLKNGKKNLGYDGVIYLLADEDVYSSAGSFKSLCTKTKRIQTIGMRTGQLLGRGFTPSVFMLPNSRLIFNMELVLDAANVFTAEDFYHDYINYPVTPGVEYYKYWYDPARPYAIDEKTMYEHDEVFLKALDIIKKEQ